MIYVDDLFTMTPHTPEARRFGDQWCHLFTDSPDLEELHQFAEKLFPNVLPGALRKHVFQPHKTLPHYDLVPSRRAMAVKLGAKEVSGEEMKAILMHEVDMRSKQIQQESEHSTMTQALFEEWDHPQGEMKPLTEVKPLPKYDNPCMALYGKGPQGIQCKSCAHLLRLHHHDKTYLKCKLRTITHGAGSDHKAHWYACARYEPERESNE